MGTAIYKSICYRPPSRLHIKDNDGNIYPTGSVIEVAPYSWFKIWCMGSESMPVPANIEWRRDGSTEFNTCTKMNENVETYNQTNFKWEIEAFLEHWAKPAYGMTKTEKIECIATHPALNIPMEQHVILEYKYNGSLSEHLKPCKSEMGARSYYGIPQQIMSTPRPSNMFLKNPKLRQPRSQEPEFRIPFLF